LNKDISEIDNIYELELHLMTTALFFADFSSVHYLNQKNSRLARSIQNNDILAVQKYARDLLADQDEFSPEEQKKYSDLYQSIHQKYGATIKQSPMPLPNEFISQIVDVGIQQQKYLSVHNALKELKQVEKKINELVHQGVQKLNSKQITFDEKVTTEEGQNIIKLAVEDFYHALRIKKPMGLFYQYSAVDWLMQPNESRRKYERYVEQGESVLKEIINGAVTFLIDDQTIANKIIDNLRTNKIRKYFLKQFSIQLIGGKEKYAQFVNQFLATVNHFKQAKNEIDFINTQRILLGRTTGSDKLIQQVKEIIRRFPVCPLFIKIEQSPTGSSYLAPLMLKEMSLFELLDFDK